MSETIVRVDPKFAYRVWQHNKRRARILGIPDTGLTRGLQTFGIAKAALDMKATLEYMKEAEQLSQTIRGKRRAFEELKDKAVKARKKSLANQYYQLASDMLVAAREANGRLEEIQKELISDGTR